MSIIQEPAVLVAISYESLEIHQYHGASICQYHTWQKGFSFRFSSSVANEPEQMPLCSVSRAQQNIKALTLASKMELFQKLQLKMGSATILPAQKILFV